MSRAVGVQLPESYVNPPSNLPSKPEGERESWNPVLQAFLLTENRLIAQAMAWVDGEVSWGKEGSLLFTMLQRETDSETTFLLDDLSVVKGWHIVTLQCSIQDRQGRVVVRGEGGIQATRTIQ